MQHILKFRTSQAIPWPWSLILAEAVVLGGRWSNSPWRVAACPVPSRGPRSRPGPRPVGRWPGLASARPCPHGPAWPPWAVPDPGSPEGPDPDPHLQADLPAQPWPVPIPGKVADAQGWGCPQLPLCLPCSPARVGGTGLAGEALPRHPWGTPEAPSSQPQEAAGPCCAVVCGEDINYHSSHENNRSRVQNDWPRAV